MRPFQYLDQPALMDMLAYVTARYTKMFSNSHTSDDYLTCRELLLLLQSEIEARNNDRSEEESQHSFHTNTGMGENAA